VYVTVFGKSAEQSFITGQVRHDPQLDLGIIRGQQHTALARDESLPDTPPFFGADRDVLQVRIR
jgi:hypothetical protein